MEKTCTRIPLGAYQANCYLYADSNRNCLIIDPGDEGEKLIQFIEKENLTPLAVLLTHAHSDHIGALDQIRDKYSIPAYVHHEEEEWLSNSLLNGSEPSMFGDIVRVRPAEEIIQMEGNLQIGEFDLQILHTPGHSPGSVSYYDQSEGIVFTGDALFKSGIGRSDFPGGNHGQLIDSIKKKILTLPEQTICLSGHGPETNIADEIVHNPFLNGF